MIQTTNCQCAIHIKKDKEATNALVGVGHGEGCLCTEANSQDGENIKSAK